MSRVGDQAERIGCDALEVDPAGRDEFVRGACGGDGALRARVDRWLRDSEAANGFLELPALAGAPEPEPPSLENYRIIRELDRGGMGVVYLAQQQRPSRAVALKVVRSGLVGGSAVRRFEHEAQVLARLQHPGIAQIYEVGFGGRGDRTPFFAMEYIEGATPITRYAEERRLNARERVALMIRVCEAVQHGHQKGVIHRDLKPANILIDAAGNPKIIDFGVALATDSDVAVTTLRTDAGQLVGTLRYMSPEQCAGDSRDLDTRCDVYALGVVLYELLTGQAPYDLTAVPIPEACRLIRECQPPRPSTVRAMLRGELETITLKALEKERERRYQSAGDLAGDLARFLRCEPIVARRASVLYQLRTFARRNKALVGGVAATMFTLAAGATVATIFAVRANTAETKAREAAGEMRTAIQSAARSLWDEQTAFRGSQNLLENLGPPDRPVPTALTAVWLRHQSLDYFDARGKLVARLDTTVATPECVRPGIPPQRFEILGAIMADVDPRPGRELVVLLAPGPGSVTHDSLLRIYDSKLNVLRELWNRGPLHSVWWDEHARLLVVSGRNETLPYYVPELVTFDSAGCPRGRLEPSFAAAVDPAHAQGVIFPIPGDDAHPPAALRWMIATRPTAPDGPHPEIQSADAPDDGRADAAGKLHFKITQPPNAGGAVSWFSAHLSPAGDPLEPLTPDDGGWNQGPPPKFEDRLLRLTDIELRARARVVVEPLLRDLGSPERVRSHLADLDPALRPAAEETLAALTANWRFLNNAAGDIVEHPRGRTRADFEKALAWSREAERLHRERCPDPEHCVAGWYAVNTLGIALYRVGQYEEAITTLARWETSNPTDPRPEDIAFMAMANQQLGRTETARALLARTRLLTQGPALPRIGGFGDPGGPMAEAGALIDAK